MSQNWRTEIMVIQSTGRLYLVNRKDAGTHGLQQVSYVWMWKKKAYCFDLRYLELKMFSNASKTLQMLIYQLLLPPS